MVRHRFTPNKFKAIATEVDNIKFPSIKEANYYCNLKILRDRTKEVLFFLRQVPFDLPGNTKYFVDFQVFYTNGEIEFVDTKGVKTKMYIMKKKQVEALYPIKITEA